MLKIFNLQFKKLLYCFLNEFWKLSSLSSSEAAAHPPITLPFSSVTETPTGTGISQSFPLEPFSALTLQKTKQNKKDSQN